MFNTIPFSEYCDTVRGIARSTKTLNPDFRSAKQQIAEHLAYDSTLAPQWAQVLKVCQPIHPSALKRYLTIRLAKDYEDVVDDSRTAAAKLSAIMNSEALH